MVTDILLRPVDGEFDVAAVRAYLEHMPYTARDAYDPDTYLMAEDAAHLADVQDARRRDHVRFPYSVILAQVSPAQVFIGCRTTEVAPARQLVEWLRSRYALRYEDADYGGDVSAYCVDNLDFLFGNG